MKYQKHYHKDNIYYLTKVKLALSKLTNTQVQQVSVEDRLFALSDFVISRTTGKVLKSRISMTDILDSYLSKEEKDPKDPVHIKPQAEQPVEVTQGLSKREQYEGMALQGLLTGAYTTELTCSLVDCAEAAMDAVNVLIELQQKRDGEVKV